MQHHRSPRSYAAARLLGAALLLAACGMEADPADTGRGDKDGSAPQLGGKSDAPLAIHEAGRFGASGQADGQFDGRHVEAFRVNGFGNTRVRVTLTSLDGNADPYLAIDGPIPGAVGTIAHYNDDAGPERFDSALEVTLTEPGGYRLLAGTYGIFKGGFEETGPFRVEFTCLEGCEIPEMALGDLIATLQQQLGPEQVETLVGEALTGLFPDPNAAALIGGQIQAVLADPHGVEAFPVLPLGMARTVQGLFEAPDVVPPAPTQVQFVVEELLTEGCVPARPEMKDVHAAIPGLQTGSWADWRIDDCALLRSHQFAEVLNNLALENGSTVSYEGTQYTSIEEVVRALIAAGHRIRIENNRYFADFLGLYFQGRAVRAPLWIDTGLDDGNGGTLKIPSPHTHHTIYVEGPLVNAQLKYYMGVGGGTSFRADASVRSHWNGERTYYTYDSEADAEAVVTVMVTAGQLRSQWAEQGRGMNAEGYGILGVCNDSTAVLEYAAEGTVTIYPLAHPPLEGEPAGPIDEILAQIPSDLEPDADPVDALRRLKETMPFESAADLPFQGLQQVMEGL